MNAHDDFDRTVSDWLDEKAGHGVPGYLDEILPGRPGPASGRRGRASKGGSPCRRRFASRPCPRLGLVVARRSASSPRSASPSWRSARRSPPAAAVRARPERGDRLRAGPTTTSTRSIRCRASRTALVTGSAGDHRPLMSPDGTRLLFLRDTTTTDATDGLSPMVMVANADGSDIRPLTGPLARRRHRSIAWSHDGSKVAVVSGREVACRRSRSSASTAPRRPSSSDADRTRHRRTWRSDRATGSSPSVARAPSGTGLYRRRCRRERLLAVPGARPQGDGASLSPDGTKIAFQASGSGPAAVIHVVDVDTGLDSIPALDPPSTRASVDDKPTWSPDGTSSCSCGTPTAMTTTSWSRRSAGGPRVEIGPADAERGCPVSAEFSPDGSKVLARYDADGSTWLLDPTGATTGTQALVDHRRRATWQRTAP